MKEKVDYDTAMKAAQEIKAMLRQACERIEIAGSLRRKCAQVGDIELVAIAKWEDQLDLFGEVIARRCLVDDVLDEFNIRRTKNGDLFKQFEHCYMPVDMFLTDETGWGVIYTIRTGSADFSHWLVSPAYVGGAMPFGMKCSERRLWREGIMLDTPEEKDVFAALGLDWIRPELRTKGFWK